MSAATGQTITPYKNRFLAGRSIQCLLCSNFIITVILSDAMSHDVLLHALRTLKPKHKLDDKYLRMLEILTHTGIVSSEATLAG